MYNCLSLCRKNADLSCLKSLAVIFYCSVFVVFLLQPIFYREKYCFGWFPMVKDFPKRFILGILKSIQVYWIRCQFYPKWLKIPTKILTLSFRNAITFGKRKCSCGWLWQYAISNSFMYRHLTASLNRWC